MALPHEILGVTENADEAAINAAFRKAAKRFHPDLNGGDLSGTKQLRLLISARDDLTKPKGRFASAQNARLRLPFRKPGGFRDVYFAFATLGAASVLSATIICADLRAGQPKIIVVEKTAKARIAWLPDAASAEFKAIRDIQEASYTPPETPAPEPQHSLTKRRHSMHPHRRRRP